MQFWWLISALVRLSDNGGDTMNTDNYIRVSNLMYEACGDKSMEIRNMGISGDD
jgi:hypothetical protein